MVRDTDAAMQARIAMHSASKLKLGLFGANCSSGRAVTLVPERWSGDWTDNVKLARMADEAGLEFMLPIGRWKGYGGDTDYQGTTYETVTWASGLLAATKRLTVFGTVHAPLIHPIIAAKEFVTADHISEGRFGLNVVCGWNEGEFEMFGVQQRDHETRYDYAQEWLDAIKMMWTGGDDVDFDGAFIKLKKVRAKPKPYGGTRPIIMNAGASPTGRAFAVRNCDALFVATKRATIDECRSIVQKAKDLARERGRDIGVYTIGVVVCRPTRNEAQDYYRYCMLDNADWSAVDNIMGLQRVKREDYSAEDYDKLRNDFANGLGGLPIVGSPDDVARDLAILSEAGFTGIALSLVNYIDELPYFCDEVLPRLQKVGVRAKN